MSLLFSLLFSQEELLGKKKGLVTTCPGVMRFMFVPKATTAV
jgi:hypothetical protein